ncbi:uncharacterized protein SPPG_05412 [Spizellomyces punctatus DAOM BR117]|uniref:Uncharacterized protein n=1 Tax=Spizellomyces punctatus (strain DAOM BR117) TaxID=645134 RepID=A0A0L0HC95_SPIPD|nr:uncharacterized protein SPPG_05412 [Spizellomyces punctatus DAOM BR117]KNC99155.1 hypothetical protein SPPG_05412 [Spizellomyces punctatus DAOM BR117]|eukprot:XP_016607195.1 hypothetical protein SPPG_05412 [Spizellomyces punctatus DAOM BR117]
MADSALILHLKICHQLDNHPQANTTLHAERAAAHANLGKAHHILGHYKQAELEYLQALDLYQTVAGNRSHNHGKLKGPRAEPDSPEVGALGSDLNPVKNGLIEVTQNLMNLCKESGKGGMARIYEHKLEKLQAQGTQ